MDFTLLVVNLLSMARKRNYNGVLCDRIFNIGGEVNSNTESNSGCSEPQTKCRKMQDSLCFKSEQLDKIINLLGKDEINTIGIHGMGGIGKTTLAKQLHARLLNYNITSTDICAYVTVGMDFTVYQLQQNLANALELDLHVDGDEIRRSGMINAFLSGSKKCILIFDDLWGDFRREDVGIPKNCKVIVISRSLNVCRILRCQKVIKIEPLSKEESWKLFHYKIGYSALDYTEVPHFSWLVYDKCAGLPLAITVLANTLNAEVNTSTWKEVLESEDPFSVGQKNQLEDVFSQLKRSYDELNNTKLQRCFLYAALYPKDWIINKEELICLWMGEGLIDNVQSLQVQYNMGHSILNKLLNTCLLETCQDERSVKMHDLIRRMALSIVKEDFMVKRNIKPSNSDYIKYLKGVAQISYSNLMISWSTNFKYTNLSVLLIQHNPLKEIPESFFKQMCSLRVLSLSHTSIAKLPNSISELGELQVLDLNTCKRLKIMPSLGKHHKLKILNLSQTAIVQIPRFIEKSKVLMELNLSYTPELKFPNWVLSTLPRLKKLSCHVSSIFNQELQTMESLEILNAKFENLDELSKYVKSQHWQELECFHLHVGDLINPKGPQARVVSLQGCSLKDQGAERPVLPYDIEELHLEDCSGFHSLSEIMNPSHAYGFKHEDEVFTSLEICTISRCQEVEKLFDLGWMQNLPSLELLEVKQCAHLKEVIAEKIENQSCYEGKKNVFYFPQLKQLVLNSLPQLKSIYDGRLVCSSLQSLIVLDCPCLNHLPLCIEDIENLVPLTLESIEGQEEWWELLKWDDSRSKVLLRPLFRSRTWYVC